MGHPRIAPDGVFNRHAVGTTPRAGHPWQAMSLASRAVEDREALREARIRAGLESLADTVERDERGGQPDAPLDLDGLKKLARVRLRRAFSED